MKIKLLYFPIFLLFICWIWQSCTTSVSKDLSVYKFYLHKAKYFENKAVLDSAFFYYNKSLTVTDNLNQNELVYPKLQMATIQKVQADFYGAETTLTEALAHYKDSLYLPYLYNLLGIVFVEQKDYDFGIQYYTKAQRVTSDTLLKLVLDNNIGVISLYKKSYPEAVSHFDALLLHPQLKKYPVEYARVLDNAGFARFKSGDIEGYSFLKRAYAIRDSLHDYQGLIASTIHLTEWYQDTNKEKAVVYAREALHRAVTIESPNDRLEALQWLTLLTDGAVSRNYFIQYHQLSDSLAMVRQTARNAFAKIKYDASVARQESEKQKRYKEQIVTAGLILLIVGSSVFVVYAVNSRRKLESSTYTAETRISKRIHDELANDVFHTMTFVQTQNLESEHTKLKLVTDLNAIYTRTRNISKENSEIRTNTYFASDLEDMMQSFSDTGCNVIKNTITDIAWEKLQPQKKIALYRVLQELLVNTRKYSEATLVVISFKQQLGKLYVTYSDNGKGFDSTQKRTSGLYNAENRIKAIKGSFIFENNTNSGCKVQLIIPN